MHFKVVFGTASLLLAATLEGEALTPEQDAAIDLVIQEFADFHRLPAVSLSIVDNIEETLVARAYGVRDIEKQLPNDNSTLFALGSISKGFTATLAARVLSQKFPLLEAAVMDTPVIKLAPDFNFTFIDRFRHESMSFRDLLAHRACLATNDISVTFGGYNGSAQEALYRTRYLPEICSFRAGFGYNNAFYTLAGELAASIAGTSYAELLQQFVEDLGMSETTVFSATTDPSTINMANVYYLRDGEILKLNEDVQKSVLMSNPAGGILSSARDMAKYLDFHINYGKVNGVQIVPEEVMKWLHVNSVGFSSSMFKESDEDFVDTWFGYGMGFVLGSLDGWEVSSHPGSLPPFTSWFSIYPGKELAIFTAVNGPTVSIPHSAVHSSIFRILSGEIASSPTSIKNELKAKAGLKTRNDFHQTIPRLNINGVQPLVNNVALDSEDLVGTFGNAVWGDLEVMINGTKIQLQYGKWFSVNLKSFLPSQNLFEVEIATMDLEAIFMIQLGIENVADIPKIYMQYLDENTLWLLEPTNLFKRGEGLSSFPSMPWAPDSCAP